jgi:hypothetical protein
MTLAPGWRAHQRPSSRPWHQLLKRKECFLRAIDIGNCSSHVLTNNTTTLATITVFTLVPWPLCLFQKDNDQGARYLTGDNFKSCLGWVFNSKLGHIAMLCNTCLTWHAATSRTENSGQGLSCQLKFVHALTNYDIFWGGWH